MIGVAATGGGEIAWITVVTGGTESAQWDFVPNPTGWRRPVVTPLGSPALAVRRHGPLALVTTDLGLTFLQEGEWRDLGNGPHGPAPAVSIPADTHNPPSDVPDLWVVHTENDTSLLLRLSFANWENNPGYADVTVPLPANLEVVALSAAATFPDEPPSVVGFARDGTLLRWVAHDQNDAEGELTQLPGLPGTAFAAGRIDGRYGLVSQGTGPDDVIVVDDTGLHLLFDPWGDTVSYRIDAPLPGHIDELRSEDLDGDGFVDLLLRDEAAGTLTIRLARP